MQALAFYFNLRFPLSQLMKNENIAIVKAINNLLAYWKWLNQSTLRSNK